MVSIYHEVNEEFVVEDGSVLTNYELTDDIIQGYINAENLKRSSTDFDAFNKEFSIFPEVIENFDAKPEPTLHRSSYLAIIERESDGKLFGFEYFRDKHGFIVFEANAYIEDEEENDESMLHYEWKPVELKYDKYFFVKPSLEELS